MTITQARGTSPQTNTQARGAKPETTNPNQGGASMEREKALEMASSRVSRGTPEWEGVGEPPRCSDGDSSNTVSGADGPPFIGRTSSERTLSPGRAASAQHGSAVTLRQRFLGVQAILRTGKADLSTQRFESSRAHF